MPKGVNTFGSVLLVGNEAGIVDMSEQLAAVSIPTTISVEPLESLANAGAPKLPIRITKSFSIAAMYYSAATKKLAEMQEREDNVFMLIDTENEVFHCAPVVYGGLPIEAPADGVISETTEFMTSADWPRGGPGQD